MGITTKIIKNSSGLTLINVEGIRQVSIFVPLFIANCSYGYWKSSNLTLLLEFFKGISMGIHTYRKGTIALIKTLYNFSNKREKSLVD